ncbi:hypothetical protein AB1Y20_006244 [Prymnesium parvum]|uniref:Glycerophosphodiester phosphodiesterase n=1 Tax=Prymnesium parvum TaxID=97485 RepID=A0AB34J492_PRYPA
MLRSGFTASAVTLWQAPWPSPRADEARAPLLHDADELDDALAEPADVAMGGKEPRHPAVLPRRLRAPLLCLAVATAVLCYYFPLSFLRAAPPCSLRLPRLISHRAFDADTADRPSAATIRELIGRGVASFDVDVFWMASAAADGSSLFVGHPPTTRALLQLEGQLTDTRVETLRATARGDWLLPLEEFLAVLRSRSALVGRTSVELKFAERPEWREQLRRLYLALASSGISDRFAVVVDGPVQAYEHREMQAALGVRLPMMVVVKDMGAERSEEDGLLHANITQLNLELELNARGSVSTIAPSVKVLHRDILDTALSHKLPLTVWVVDTEPELRHAWQMQVEGLITNRPAWAMALLNRWLAECKA